MATENKKNRQSFEKIDRISLPIIYTEYTDNGKSVPIQPFRGKSSLSDSRRTSISSGISTFSSDSFDSNVTKDITAKNISTKELFGSFENKKSHDFIYEGSVDDMLSSLSFNDTNRNSRSLSSFTTFSDTESTSIEGNKSKRRMSVDSGIDSSSEANKLLSFTVSQNTTKDSEDKKISTNEGSFASIRKSSIQDRSVRLAKKVALPTVPTLKSKSSDVNNSNLTSVIDEDLGNVTKKVSRKDQLSSKIDEFIPQVNLSARKTVEERVKYGTLDMLRISVGRLNLKINKVDSLLQAESLNKVDKNNNSEVLLITKKDISLLKELKRDLEKELHKAKQDQGKEIKSIQAREQQKQLQGEVLKNDIGKIRGIISTVKSKVDLKKLLGRVQTCFSSNEKLHHDPKKENCGTELSEVSSAPLNRSASSLSK